MLLLFAIVIGKIKLNWQPFMAHVQSVKLFLFCFHALRSSPVFKLKTMVLVP